MFLVEPVFSRYFRKFLVTIPSAEMTKGCTDTMLSFQIFFVSGSNFHISKISLLQFWEGLWVKGTAISITSVVLLLFIDRENKTTH